ncbi:MAG: glycosyltransferase [Candidatus Microsaccharimonas sp.]
MKKRAVLIRNAAATDFGGGERVPVFIASELLKHGFEVVVLSRSQKLLTFATEQGVPSLRSWWWSRQNWSGIKTLLFPVYFLWQIILLLYYIVIFLVHRPQVVHLQSKDDFIAGSIAARLLGMRVIWSDHADLKHIWLNHTVWYKNPVGKLVYFAAHFAHKIIVVSRSDFTTIVNLIPDGKVKQKMIIIHNGAFDSYKETKKEALFTFVSTARLVTDKGIAELIRAFQRLHKDHPNTQLQLVGEGPEQKRFKALAKKNPAIHFLGYKSHPLDYVAKAHIFVLPTYHEGFSLALVEACMEGSAIIATNVGGNPEIIDDEKTGLLVKAKDSDDLYEAMLKLYKDKALQKKLGEAARKKYLSAFDYKKIIKNKILPIYKEHSI